MAPSCREQAFTNTLTLQMKGNETIYEGNKTPLEVNTNATSFSWTPTDGLNDATLETPTANPSSSTTYFLTATTGPWSLPASVHVIVNPAPVAAVSKDTTVCYGGKAQLSGSRGVSFAWSPSTFLNNDNSFDPIAFNMTAATNYSLAVTDALGCSSIVSAIVHVQVTPQARVFAGDDTAIHVDNSVQLTAVDLNNSGFNHYEWSPVNGLSDPNSNDPVATITQNITYIVQATTPAGCAAMDTISIEAYTLSDIFVPSGFTPNGDGHNDVLGSILMGVRDFNYFAVYNQWGQRVFYTAEPKAALDGTLNGVAQNADNYV